MFTGNGSRGVLRRFTGAQGGGFSLVELVGVLAVVVSVGAVLGPSVGKMRSQMRGVSSEGNLATIGQAGAMYALDNDDRIFSFTWRKGGSYLLLHSGKYKTPSTDTIAAAWQVQNILQRATGRIDGTARIVAPQTRLMHRRYTHLVLADYMGGNVSDPMWIDPADSNQLHWQLNPLDFGTGSTVPYANGQPADPVYDTDANWQQASIRQLWPFASSYQVVPHAWQQDFGNQYIPVSETPHIFSVTQGIPNGISLGERRYSEVQFPSAKVHMFEEFDREQEGSPYFAYDFAAPAKLMFDGSINTAMSGLARSSVSPRDYLLGDRYVWEQNYVPLDTFPLPIETGGESELNMRYRWTLGGLTGADYPQVLMRGR